MANLSNINNKFLVTTGGNVGIGVTGPTEKLVVASTAGFIATFQSLTATDFRPIRFINSSGANVGFLGNNGSTNEFSLIAQDRPLRFGTGNGGAERMRIASSGVTTIGMTNTFGSAEVRIGFTGNATGNGTGKLQFVNSNSYKSWQISAGGTPLGALAFTQSASFGQDNFTEERMRILSDGNVTISNSASIGTAIAPTRTLDVRGTGLSIFGSGNNTELMLRGQVEGTGTVRNVGAFHLSVRGDVGGDNDDLKFLRFINGAYNGISMQISNTTGYIGIGTDNPVYPLNVKNSSTAYIFSETTAAGGASGYRWKTPDSEFSWYSAGGADDMNLYDYTAGAIRMTINSSGATFKQDVTINGAEYVNQIQARTGAGLKLGNDDNSGFIFIDDNSNVGIGTTLPEGKLTIQYTSADPPTSGTTANSAIQILSNLSPPHQLNIGVVNAPSYGSYIQASDNNLAVNYALLLQPNGGNVGIGTTSPGAKLHNYSTSTQNVWISGYGTLAQNNWGAGHAIFAAEDNGLLISKANADNDTNRLFSFYHGNGGDAEFYMYNTGGTNVVKIDSSGNTYFNGGNVGIQETGPTTRLQIQGCLGIGSAVYDGNITRSFFNFSQQDGGSLHINIGLGGGASSGDTITFEYAAVSWKSWSLSYNFASTSGISYGVVGGYWNNSGGSSNQTQQNNLGVSVAVTHNGQSNLITFTFTNLGTHAMANFVYMQSGGDGQPIGSRVTIGANS